MVRTRADNTARRAVVEKAPRKALVNPSPRSSLTSPKGRSGSSSKNRWAGGNPIVKREIPDWQKKITGFFSPKKDKENATPEDESEDNDIVEIGESSKDVPSAQSSGTPEPSSSSSSSKKKDDLMDSDDDE